jgi:hypothetical protein
MGDTNVNNVGTRFPSIIFWYFDTYFSSFSGETRIVVQSTPNGCTQLNDTWKPWRDLWKVNFGMMSTW